VAPDNAAANFNMGLLKAEKNDLEAAEQHLRAALKADPQMAQAAYNLCVILSKDRIDEAMDLCRKAAEMRPDVPRYAFTLAFYQHQRGNSGEALKVLQGLTALHPTYLNAYLLLAEIYEQQGQAKEAENAYRKVLASEGLSSQERDFIESKLKKLSPP
jgi:tetratricopeptide (TPR) repeat protein